MKVTGELMAAISLAIIVMVYVPDRLEREYEVWACTGDGFTMLPELTVPLPLQDRSGKASRLRRVAARKFGRVCMIDSLGQFAAVMVC
jgi:hypothetical protein